MSLVDESMPISGHSIEHCLDFFFEQVVPGMTRVNHPRFHAYIPAPSSFAGTVGEMLAAGTNPFVGSWLGGATVSALEMTVLRWIREMLECPGLAAGILTSGGSMANLVSLAAARQRYGRRVLEQGVVYVSAEGHASMTKAAQILGFTRQVIQVIEVDGACRMRADRLAEQIAIDRAGGRLPFFVSANAGTTNTGAIDPLSELAELCQRSELWFHVDAAYGGFAAILPGIRKRMAGLERADSITMDPHKWLYCPMGVGCVLIRDADNLEAAFSAEGHYLKDLPVDEINFLNRGPELSRPARVLSAWMVIRSVGLEGLQYQVEEDLRLARLAAQLLCEDDRLEVSQPELSIVPFRHRLQPGESEPDRARRDIELMEATLASGDLMLSTTRLGETSTLRLVVMNHRTGDDDVIRSVNRIRSLVVGR